MPRLLDVAGGHLARWNLRTGESRDIQPRPRRQRREQLRFNWNAGLAHDPFEPGTIYIGSQFVHKSTDRGDDLDGHQPGPDDQQPRVAAAGRRAAA